MSFCRSRAYGHPSLPSRPSTTSSSGWFSPDDGRSQRQPVSPRRGSRPVEPPLESTDAPECPRKRRLPGGYLQGPPPTGEEATTEARRRAGRNAGSDTSIAVRRPRVSGSVPDRITSSRGMRERGTKNLFGSPQSSRASSRQAWGRGVYSMPHRAGGVYSMPHRAGGLYSMRHRAGGVYSMPHRAGGVNSAPVGRRAVLLVLDALGHARRDCDATVGTPPGASRRPWLLVEFLYRSQGRPATVTTVGRHTSDWEVAVFNPRPGGRAGTPDPERTRVCSRDYPNGRQ